MINSRQKGKRGELDLVKFLKTLGFPDARRSQQYCGADSDADVVCPDTLPHLFIECKFGVQGFDFGTKKMSDAITQMVDDASAKNLRPILFFKKTKGVWISVIPMSSFTYVLYLERDIKIMLLSMNDRNFLI